MTARPAKRYAPAFGDEAGSALLFAIVLTVVIGAVIAVQMSRLQNLVLVTKTESMRSERARWASYVASRIDCSRTMSGFTQTRPCNAGTDRQLSLIDVPNAPVGAPDASQALGKGWFAKLSCGSTDLRLHLAKYVGGSFVTDPLTRTTLDFANIASRVSDEAGGVALCPEYFGTGVPDVRTITMSILTLQAIGFNQTPTGQATGLATTCDSRLGLMALVDDFSPLDALWRKPGTDGLSPASFTQLGLFTYTGVLNYANWPSYGGNVQMTFETAAFQGPGSGANNCDFACTSRYGASAGFMAKCDPSIAATTVPYPQVRADSTIGQVECMCLR